MNHLAVSLTRLRKKRGLSHQQLADLAGVARMTIQRLEAGEDVRLHTLLGILRVFDMDLMPVPELLRTEVEHFIQAEGKVLGQPPGTEGPLSIVDQIRLRQGTLE